MELKICSFILVMLIYYNRFLEFINFIQFIDIYKFSGFKIKNGFIFYIINLYILKINIKNRFNIIEER